MTSVRLVDENGVDYGLKHISNKQRVSAMPYTYDISEGNVTNHAYFRMLAYNGDVGTTLEDLWIVGGSYTFPTGGMGMEVVSSSANDTSAGSGAQTVSIHYLDDSFAEQSETVTLTGQTPKATIATDIYRINEFHVATGTVAAGNIDLRHLDDTPIYSRIAAGMGTALTGVWTVPASKTAYIVSWNAGAAGGNKDARFLLRATCSSDGTLTAGVFQEKDILILEDGATESAFIMPVKIPAQADIKISVISAANAALCSSHVEGWYES